MNNNKINKLRTETIKRILDISPTICMNETTDYFGFFEKQNFVEVHKTKKLVKIVINSKALQVEQSSRCRIVPDSHEWTLNAEYRYSNSEDLDFVIELIKASYNYAR